MERVYIAGKNTIQLFELNLQSGALTAVGDPVDKDGCGSFIALSEDGQCLYSIAKPGAAAFRIDPGTGALGHINSVKCDVPGAAHLSVTCVGDVGLLLTAGYGGGGVNVVKIRADGGLHDVETGSAILHTGGSNVYQPARGNEQEQAHPHQCFIDPSGKWALVSDLGQDKRYVYAIDVRGGKLTEHAVVPSAPGAGPRHMCIHPRGRYVYGINELDCTIDVFEFSPGQGVLGPKVQTVSTLPVGYNNRDHSNAKNAKGGPASGPNRPEQTNAASDVHFTPNGRFLFGSNRGHDSLVCYSVQEDGILVLVGFTYVNGEHPRTFNIHPSGKWLLAANQDSGNVAVFKLDSTTGSLTPMGYDVKVPTARCIAWAVPPTTIGDGCECPGPEPDAPCRCAVQ